VIATRETTQFSNDAVLNLESGSLPPAGQFLLFKTDEDPDDMGHNMIRLSAHWQRAVREVIRWLQRISEVPSVLSIRTDGKPNTCRLGISLGYLADSGPPEVTDEHIRQLLRIFETHLDETIELASS